MATRTKWGTTSKLLLVLVMGTLLLACALILTFRAQHHHDAVARDVFDREPHLSRALASAADRAALPERFRMKETDALLIADAKSRVSTTLRQVVVLVLACLALALGTSVWVSRLIHRPLHELAQTEAALGTAQERFERAVRGMNDGLWEDEFASGHSWNAPRILEMLGYTEEEMAPTRDGWVSLGVGARIPIVALTAQVMKGADLECKAAGMDEYLAKPLDRAKLRACLEHFLGKPPELAQCETSAPQGLQSSPSAAQARCADRLGAIQSPRRRKRRLRTRARGALHRQRRRSAARYQRCRLQR